MKKLALAIALVAFLGMVDALYLSLKRNSGPIPCHVTRGCTDVLTSRYSELQGIPISWFGLAFYFGVLSLAIFELFEPGRLLRWIFYIAAVALVISVFLTGVQAFVLKTFCEYCLLSATLVLTIFLLSGYPLLRRVPRASVVSRN